MIPASQLRSPSAESATLDQPLEHLLACHRRIEQRLDSLLRAAHAIESRPEEARTAIANVLRFLSSSGAWHTEDEERSLFPRLRARGLTGEDDAYLRELESQHHRVEALVERLRDAAPDGFAALADETARAYRDHIAFEEARLIGVARTALTAADLAEISGEMKSRRGIA